MSTFKLMDGDNITVDGMLNRYENMVEIKGAVFRPGMFNLNGQLNSVRALVEAAEGLTEDAFSEHAIIHRLKADRTLEIIPVNVKGVMEGTVADVPLQNEDVVFIPTQEEMRKERNFTITGEVMNPGSYEYADNTTIEDLIVQAGGLRDGANLARVDVSRRINDPKATKKTREIAQTFTFELKNGLMIDGDKSFILEPYDVVHVRRSPGYVMPRNISVTGEVNYEGSFTLEKKNIRLTDAINMAGGVTDDAYIKGARLYRQMNPEERQRQQAVLDAIRNNLGRKDSISWDKMELEATYPIGIQLDKALENPGSDLDIVLREGDHIDVPEYNGTVKIAGDVQFPNTITFTQGKGYKWYVNNAGGFSQTAKKSKTFVIYPNGMMAKCKSGTKIEPGSEIVVPSKKERRRLSVADWVNALSGLTSLSTMVMAIAYLTK
jgi:protein involved in polysaccharide export with SLBB domain